MWNPERLASSTRKLIPTSVLRLTDNILPVVIIWLAVRCPIVAVGRWVVFVGLPVYLGPDLPGTIFASSFFAPMSVQLTPFMLNKAYFSDPHTLYVLLHFNLFSIKEWIDPLNPSDWMRIPNRQLLRGNGCIDWRLLRTSWTRLLQQINLIS